MHRRTPLATLACLTMLTLAACGGGEADPADYPDDDITFVVPFAAGGPTDTVTRLIAEPMAEELGGEVVVQNVEGAGGTVAAGQVADAAGPGPLRETAHAMVRAMRRGVVTFEADELETDQT